MKIDSSSVVVITGASRGIGKEAALAFASRGANVVIASRDQIKMKAVAQEVDRLGGKSHQIQIDVSVESSCQYLIAETIKTFGKIDVLVNNAGYGHYASIETVRTDDLEAIFKTNLYGALWCTQAVLPHMRSQKRGHIVNVSTVISERSVPYMSAYCMTKFAMNAMDEALRLEVKRYGIDVSLVCPGMTQTDFQTNAGKVDYQPPVSNTHGMSAAKVGQVILNSVECRRRRVYLTSSGWALVWLQRFSPRLVDEIIDRLYSKNKEPVILEAK